MESRLWYVTFHWRRKNQRAFGVNESQKTDKNANMSPVDTEKLRSQSFISILSLPFSSAPHLDREPLRCTTAFTPMENYTSHISNTPFDTMVLAFVASRSILNVFSPYQDSRSDAQLQPHIQD
jgi:hypothetical protein